MLLVTPSLVQESRNDDVNSVAAGLVCDEKQIPPVGGYATMVRIANASVMLARICLRTCPCVWATGGSYQWEIVSASRIHAGG